LATLIFGIAVFIACSNEEITKEKASDSEILNKSLVEDILMEDENFLKGISFEGVFDNLVLFKDFSVPITEQENVKQILLKYITENFNAFNENSEDIVSISYSIVHNGDKLSFINFSVVENSSNYKHRGTPVGYTCPAGQSLVKTCYFQSCVEETLKGLAGNFSSGSIITIEHTGLGGVKIYSNIKTK